jgi:hypothetical protein
MSHYNLSFSDAYKILVGPGFGFPGHVADSLLNIAAYANEARIPHNGKVLAVGSSISGFQITIEEIRHGSHVGGPRSTVLARRRELARLEKLLGRFWDSMGDDFRPEDHVTIGNAYAIIARAHDAAQ